MDKDLQEISAYWQERYSRQIKEYRPFEIKNEFVRFASLFAPGNSYFYVVNLHNFSLEFISGSVEVVTGMDPAKVNLHDLLQMVLPEEVESLRYKSRVNSDFYTSFVDPKEVLIYKNMFSYRMKNVSGEIKTMLYQAFPLSVLENGAPEHVFCIHTDVSHLKMSSNNTVSFLHMNGGRSYFNVDISSGKFEPAACDAGTPDLSKLLTQREKEIITAFSKGLNAEQIALELNLSPHTIKTHRRNILQKSNSINTTELVAKCLINGIISPALK